MDTRTSYSCPVSERIFFEVGGDLDVGLAETRLVGMSTSNAKKLSEKEDALKNIEGAP